MCTPVNPNFTIIKVGCKGSSLHVHVSIMYRFLYFVGPQNKPNGPRHWSGCGSKEDKKLVKDSIAAGADWAKTNIPVYFGEWMANDNNGGTLNQKEAECFGCYFAKILKRNGIPWSMNDLDLYYDTKRMKGIKRVQTIPKKTGAKLKTLDIVREVRRCM